MINLEKLNQIEERFEFLEAKLTQQLRADEIRDIGLEYSELKIIVEKIQAFKKITMELEEVESALDDPELRVLALDEKKYLSEQLSNVRNGLITELIPKDEADTKPAILEIRAGTGGDEAALFASDLLRMYQKFSDKMGWKVKLISESNNELGGLKEVVVNISGKTVFQYLKYESGVHRVQRVPVTESGGRVHTSAATVAVLPEAEEVDVLINQSDLRIDTMRASGAGGQHVNTTDSAVRITHLPTGIVVTSSEKSQHQNRANAMQVLRSKLYEQERELKNQERDAERKEKVGSGDRSERIRTYNFPQGRITDHRINLTLHKLNQILEGDLEELIEALKANDRLTKLSNLSDE
ncbi:MAG: peptide chain release factor 1 [Paracoccaceae bacterium]